MPTHGSKRKRLSAAAGRETRQSEDKHQLFTNWAKDRGVEVHGVKPAGLPGRGIGLVATEHLRDGDRLLFIPERAMFKPDSDLLKREGLDRTSPQAQLAVSAMLAFGRADSSLKLWESVWPTVSQFKASMPMCWTTVSHQHLPPSVHQPLERQLADYRKDWNAVRVLCMNRGFSEEDFKYYWMIVNSRSFHWKPLRGNGGVMVMCPFIDYINHGPTKTGCHVVQTGKGYEVTATRSYGKPSAFFEPQTSLLSTCKVSMFSSVFMDIFIVTVIS